MIKINKKVEATTGSGLLGAGRHIVFISAAEPKSIPDAEGQFTDETPGIDITFKCVKTGKVINKFFASQGYHRFDGLPEELKKKASAIMTQNGDNYAVIHKKDSKGKIIATNRVVDPERSAKSADIISQIFANSDRMDLIVDEEMDEADLCDLLTGSGEYEEHGPATIGINVGSKEAKSREGKLQTYAYVKGTFQPSEINKNSDDDLSDEDLIS